MTNEKGFRKLRAWRKADELACEVFLEMARQPTKPPWLASQVSRAAVSVPANVAEGYGRCSLGDYLRFLDIALGSLAEPEYYLHFMGRIGVLTGHSHERLTRLHSEAAALLVGLCKSLKAKSRAGTWDRRRGVGEAPTPYELEHGP